jgi:hypothetical protein
MRPNPAPNLAPFGRWTLRDKAAQRRLVLRWESLFMVTRIALLLFFAAFIPTVSHAYDASSMVVASKGTEVVMWVR